MFNVSVNIWCFINLYSTLFILLVGCVRLKMYRVTQCRWPHSNN